MIVLRRTLLIVAPMALLGAWAWWHASLLDDAYISFRYARNLVDGHGLVFNIGEYVEGYTNFAWILLLAGVWALFDVTPVDSHAVLSSLQTVALGLVVAALALRSRRPGWRDGILAIAMLLWCTNRSVAVWTTSGLEMRQFSLFTTLGLWLLADGRSRRWLVAGSLAWAMAELTRPEALLFAPVAMVVWGVHRGRRGRLTWEDTRAVILPFAAVVLAHEAWRFATYGEWLPNTYYAKAVRPWWEAGIRFWGLVTLEHGLYVLVPVAIAGAVARWRSDDPAIVMGLAWMLPQSLHLAQIGGDHFEFRMLDPYWPILAVGAAEGLASLAEAAARRAAGPERGIAWAGTLVVGLVVLVASGTFLPLHHDWMASSITSRGQAHRMALEASADRTPLVAAVPPFRWMMGTWNDLQRWTADHYVALRAREHQLYGVHVARSFAPYGDYAVASRLPADAVALEGNVGAFGYYLPGLPIIDRFGLTDAVIARAPVARTNEQRSMAHDRRPPAGYLDRRGVNLEIEPFATSREAALRAAPFALQLGPEAWLPFRSLDAEWVATRFATRPLFSAGSQPVENSDPDAPPGEPVPERVEHGGVVYSVIAWLGRFDGDDLDGWTAVGRAFSDAPVRGTWRKQLPVTGYEGRGLLNSYDPGFRDSLQGTVTSPPFTPIEGQSLTFLVGGGSGDDTAVVVRSGRVEVGRWRGARNEQLRRVVVPLDRWVGQQVQIAVEDRSDGSWGHVLADGFALVEPVP